MGKLLEVKNLETSFKTNVGEVHAVRGVSFYLNQGEALGIVGESGCGKSVTMMSIMRLIDSNGKIVNGDIIFDGKDISKVKDSEMNSIRGNDIGMIFQDPMTSLNPVYTIGDQLMEPLLKHKGMSKEEARKEAIEMLGLVGIPSPEKRMKHYPHEFSGGMRQRAMIAIALACNPKILLADEPTTALDVTIQAQIMDLIKDLQDKFQTAVVLVTHDLGVVADVADRIQVMYSGLIVERGTVDEIFYNAQHPYTWALLQSVPRLDTKNKAKLYSLNGTPPDLLKPPVGCPFAARCEYAMNICKEAMPEATKMSDSHEVSCWLKHPNAPKVKNPIGGSDDE